MPGVQQNLLVVNGLVILELSLITNSVAGFVTVLVGEGVSRVCNSASGGGEGCSRVCNSASGGGGGVAEFV